MTEGEPALRLTVSGLSNPRIRHGERGTPSGGFKTIKMRMEPPAWEGKNRHRPGCTPYILDLLSTKQERDIEKPQIYSPLGRGDHVIIKWTNCAWRLNTARKMSKTFEEMDVGRLHDGAL